VAVAGNIQGSMEDIRHRGLVHDTGHAYAEASPESGPPVATLGGRPLLSNRGLALNLDWVEKVRVNTSAVERRAQTHVARRTVKKEWQAAWLLRAITCMDLTTLSGDDTDERVRRLCAKAKQPIERDLATRLGIEDLGIQVAAVCVYHRFVETARRALEGSRIKVAAVSTGFPAGLSPLEERVAEIRHSVEAGAQEIDVVITRAHVFGGRWQELYDEISAFKQASGTAHMKVILGTGDLLTLGNVARASFVAMMAGADFIKTDERYPARGVCHDPCHPGVCARNRHGGRLQAGRWHSHGQAVDRMAGDDERGTWSSVDEGRSFSLWSKQPVE
jgi:deoxyribose-phosphate aldolase